MKQAIEIGTPGSMVRYGADPYRVDFDPYVFCIPDVEHPTAFTMRHGYLEFAYLEVTEDRAVFVTVHGESKTTTDTGIRIVRGLWYQAHMAIVGVRPWRTIELFLGREGADPCGSVVSVSAPESM